jgi:hypothetical protein
MAVVLLRGDPTYLVQAHDKAGFPVGNPAPVRFPWRAFSVTALAAGLLVAAFRVLSEAGEGVRLPALIGYTLFALDAVVRACVGPAFPAYLAGVWLVIPLVVIVYSESISELVEGRVPAPPWVFWGLCLLILLAKLIWPLFARFAE